MQQQQLTKDEFYAADAHTNNDHGEATSSYRDERVQPDEEDEKKGNSWSGNVLGAGGGGIGGGGGSNSSTNNGRDGHLENSSTGNISIISAADSRSDAGNKGSTGGAGDLGSVVGSAGSIGSCSSASDNASLYSRNLSSENVNVLGGYRTVTKEKKQHRLDVLGQREVFTHPSSGDTQPLVLVLGKAVPRQPSSVAAAAAKAKTAAAEATLVFSNSIKLILTISTVELPQLILTRPPPMPMKQ